MPSGHRPQPPPPTARVAISGNGAAGNSWVNVFWLYLGTSNAQVADFHDTLAAIVDAYYNRLGGYISSAYEITLIKGSWLYNDGNVFESQVAVAHAGGGSSSYASDATCTLINWSISDYYRGGHPRTYLPGTPDNEIVNGRTLNAGFLSNVATNANAFLADVNALTIGDIAETDIGTVRFASGNAWLNPPVFKPYVGASVAPVIATQRRRLHR
jgi:hypothetical protein